MVESEELIIETAKSVKASGASFLRGGAFKPLSFLIEMRNIQKRA